MALLKHIVSLAVAFSKISPYMSRYVPTKSGSPLHLGTFSQHPVRQSIFFYSIKINATVLIQCMLLSHLLHHVAINKRLKLSTRVSAPSAVRHSVHSLELQRSYEPRHEKTCLCYMRTTKVQISLRIRTVWSAPSLFHYLDSIIPILVKSKISRL